MRERPSSSAGQSCTRSSTDGRWTAARARFAGEAERPKIITAHELEQMMPEQRAAAFEASLVCDLDEPSPEFRARIEARGRRLVEEHRRSAPE